jgi:hypothetical protein
MDVCCRVLEAFPHATHQYKDAIPASTLATALFGPSVEIHSISVYVGEHMRGSLGSDTLTSDELTYSSTATTVCVRLRSHSLGISLRSWTIGTVFCSRLDCYFLWT